MSAITKRDVIDAAMSVAEDVAESRLDSAQLDQAIAEECKALFGTVVGEGDSLWSLHRDVCRQALALGALTADELSEWLAVARSRAGEPISSTPPAVSSANVVVSSDTDGAQEIPADPIQADPVDDELERAATADSDCGCGGTSLANVMTADGRRIPSRLIIARGRGLPDPNYLV